MSENCKLQTLNLSDNLIGKDGVKAIANAMKVNKTLQKLMANSKYSDTIKNTFGDDWEKTYSDTIIDTFTRKKIDNAYFSIIMKQKRPEYFES